MSCKFRIEKRKDKKTGEIIEINVPIYADINIKGLRITYSTGYRVDSSKWVNSKLKDDKTGEVVHKQCVLPKSYGTRSGIRVPAHIINGDLEIIRATVANIIKTTPIEKITAKLVISEIDEQISKLKNSCNRKFTRRH